MVKSDVRRRQITVSGASAVRLSWTGDILSPPPLFIPPNSLGQRYFYSQQHTQLPVFNYRRVQSVCHLSGLIGRGFPGFFKQVERLDQVSPSSRFLPEEWEVCRGGRAETLRSERTKGQKRRELLLKMEEKTLPGATRKSLLTGWNLVSLNDLATVLSVTHISTLRGNLKLCPAEVQK